MPAKSEKQAKFMRAVAHGWKPGGKDAPSEGVARKFMHVEGKVSKPKRNLKKIIIGTALAGATAAGATGAHLDKQFQGVEMLGGTGNPKTVEAEEEGGTKKKEDVNEYRKAPTPEEETKEAKKKAGAAAGKAIAIAKGKSKGKVTRAHKTVEKHGARIGKAEAATVRAKAETEKTKEAAKKQSRRAQATRSSLGRVGKDVAATQTRGKELEKAAAGIESQRSAVHRKGEELEKKKTGIARAGSRLQTNNTLYPGLSRLFDRKDVGKEVGQKETSPEEVYRKSGIGHTPEDERPGLPAIDKNKKWFQAMLKKHLSSKHKKAQN